MRNSCLGGREGAGEHMSMQFNSELTIQEEKHFNAPSLILSIPTKVSTLSYSWIYKSLQRITIFSTSQRTHASSGGFKSLYINVPWMQQKQMQSNKAVHIY